MVLWNNENLRRTASLVCVAVLAIVALYLCYLIGKPFLTPVIVAVMFGIVFYPVHTRIQSRIRRKNLAAALSTTLVFLLATIPMVILGFAVTRELGDLMQSLREHRETAETASPYWIHLREVLLDRIGRYVAFSKFDPYVVLLRWTEQASRYLLSFGAALLGNLLTFALDSFVVFFCLFFLFRDGPEIHAKLSAILPVDQNHMRRLFARVSETMIGSFYGSLAVGAAQGFLAGLSFWVLGLPAPILWALVTGFASLVPVVGSALVWGPAALGLALTGHWVKALILLAWGAFVVGQIDVLVRPLVIGTHVKIHSLFIFFALLGGIKAFGVIGLFVGPLVLSVMLALLDWFRTLALNCQPDSCSNAAPEMALHVKRP